ncbi:hypothetical protein OG455_05855 [Kitasatospora sp. NBC_01287]|uniref:aminomethyltransferase family protein n=1 Tax=Kitasatospora sp. NBC_01287 TaxID=2903573 RepID=UPI00224E9416|nr:glycine cleavage T C-terminal barrel domain-containing protein [Kitasatospora sp. NBC_01287]MCX4745053.1 hypothetical protein [Kitasatospora sp. NBC_01287]
MTARLLPLHEEHTALGARMVESDGWLLPLEFTGAFQEYRAHRSRSVLWDASDLGSILVSGPGAFEALQRTFTNDLRRIRPGRSQYTFLLAAADAGVVDDLMVWWVAEDRFVLTPSRPDPVLRALRATAGPAPACTVEDVSGARVLLALQGAEAVARLAPIVPEAAAMPLFGVREVEVEDGWGLIATTGFGRRLGFELDLPIAAARAVHRRLIDAGVVPAGLAMRETHRLESGTPRHGYELGPSIDPLEAGCARAVALDTEFVGRAALLARRADGPTRMLRSVVLDSRQAPSTGSELIHNGAQVGRITSGNYSFRLHRGLGLAFVSPEVPVGSTVCVRTARGEVGGTVGVVPVEWEGVR